MELTVAASLPRLLSPSQTPSDAKLAQAVNEMVFQMKQTVATTPSMVTSHKKRQSNTCAVSDHPTTRIPRVASTGASRPRASGSSHSRLSRRDQSNSPERSAFLSEGATIRWTRSEPEPRWKAIEPYEGVHATGGEGSQRSGS